MRLETDSTENYYYKPTNSMEKPIMIDNICQELCMYICTIVTYICMLQCMQMCMYFWRYVFEWKTLWTNMINESAKLCKIHAYIYICSGLPLGQQNYFQSFAFIRPFIHWKTINWILFFFFFLGNSNNNNNNTWPSSQ